MNDLSSLPFNIPPARVAREGLAEGLATQLGYWARRIGTVQHGDTALLARVARELALAACDGHVCLPLTALTGTSADKASSALLASGMAVEAEKTPSHVLAATAFPLVIDNGRLYLRAFFDLESRLSHALNALAAPLPDDAATISRIRDALDSVFPPREGVDWQKVAAALALTRRLTIISGGPGTGKTTTVAALIACLVELEPDLRIALAAPTGKAAARLREALDARTRDLPETARAWLPAEAHTIHRLLGATATPGRFRHHGANPLALDLLVVDEASMLDLALAASLLDALPPHARLVLLGDKDQLAAVEAGAVFADLSSGWRFQADKAARLAALTGAPEEILLQGAGSEAALPDSIVWLLDSHRFRADSGIGRLAREINAGEGAAALARLKTQADPAVLWIEDEIEDGNATPGVPPPNAVLTAMEEGYAAYFSALRETFPGEPLETRATKIFAAFEHFRVLVAVREGPRGLAAANAHLERHARAILGTGSVGMGPFWTGRPVIVLENDPVTRLFNGDIGLCLPDGNGALTVVFPAPGGGIRTVPPRRLPGHGTAFALTVHKSQGSEFSEVLLLLPARPVRVLSRELLYTAVTRAACRVTIACGAAVFEAGCAGRAVRFSGLGERLRNRSGG
ncbi:MAG: exodeoxyribonuclease V subunit alpha [Azoarcus sp.]|jgi:exodeoxyribonuclease V alpha subunit|nr:exodeoxyribonuclease V subunit alpha [Azoarcus sp.]